MQGYSTGQPGTWADSGQRLGRSCNTEREIPHEYLRDADAAGAQ